jgi:hypothetical protein
MDKLKEYICIKRCFTDGKLWEEGEITLHDTLPNKHFELLSTHQKRKEKQPDVEVRSFSQMMQRGQAMGGFASGYMNGRRINSMRDLQREEAK